MIHGLRRRTEFRMHADMSRSEPIRTCLIRCLFYSPASACNFNKCNSAQPGLGTNLSYIQLIQPLSAPSIHEYTGEGRMRSIHESPAPSGPLTPKYVCSPLVPTLHRCSLQVADPAEPDKAMLQLPTRSIIIFVVVSLLFRELLFPHVVGLLCIQTREDQIEHIRVPLSRPAFDALLDILPCG